MFKFLKHVHEFLRQDNILAIAFGFLFILYAVVFTANFLAPYSETFHDDRQSYAPPTPVFIVNSQYQPIWPCVYPYEKRFDASTYSSDFFPNTSKCYPIHFLAHGEPYKLLGLITTDRHLIGVESPARLFLLGSDVMGQDIFSRLLFGGQISLTIGFLSLFIALPIGLFYGGLSGYLGGKIDIAMMRFAEIMMSFPQLYLLFALVAILPPQMDSRQRLNLIIMILALIGWPSLARVIRGMVMSYKNEEYIQAAQTIGVSTSRIIWRHLLPQTSSFIIISITLGVPGYLLAESGLSFLGLGVQPPGASWGNLLQEAQNLTNILDRPCLFIAPSLLIVLTILAYNYIGDRLRDWLDPKSMGAQ